MYWERFGFVEPPFALTPNPGFLFLSACHQEALAHLLYGIDHQAAFIELSGEVGSGKTTLLRSLLAQLDPALHRTALIFNPPSSPVALLQEVNREFGLAFSAAEPRELLAELNAFLLRENGAGRSVILVVDEAQNLSPEVLEQVRLISNLETESAKLIQIVLAGQPELRGLLDRRELRQLRQRITVSFHLEKMGRTDTAEYIRHRVRVASRGGEPVVFTGGAVRRIYSFSRGLPRLVNALCDRALLVAYTEESSRISWRMAGRAAADLRRERRPRRLLQAAGAAACCGVLLAGVQLYRQPEVSAPPARVAEAVPAPMPALTADEGSLLSAANAVLRMWKAPEATAATDLASLAASRGLTATDVTEGLAALAKLDAPAVLHFPLSDGGVRYAALTGIAADRVILTPPLPGRASLSSTELSSIWKGKSTVLWKNFYEIPVDGKGRVGKKGVKPLKQLLHSAGVLERTSGATFDRETQDAVRRFQEREGIVADGKPGERTLLALYSRAGGFFPPAITRPAGAAEAGGKK